jgi:predicted nucleotidyltransferase
MGARKPKDRDFIQTKEGMLFCVTGYLHPPDKYTAYLKYSPAPVGKWKSGGISYRRELEYYHVGKVADTIAFLKRNYPQYVHDCPVRGIKFSMVPQEYVKRYYLPEKRLREIMVSTSDVLEEEVYAFASEIMSHAGIREEDLGVTGSILLGIHNPRFSDIDLLVYGLENALKVRAMIKEERSDRIRGVDGKALQDWCATVAEHFPLSYEEARYLAGRRWNYGFFEGRYFSIHPTRKDAEIGENYGDRVYREKGVARVRAVVSDASESLLMPAVYRVENVEVLEGAEEMRHRLREIVSYEGLYRDVVDSGKEVDARGKLESVNNQYYRLVVGTTMLEGEGYIKPTIERKC